MKRMTKQASKMCIRNVLDDGGVSEAGDCNCYAQITGDAIQ
jgi:hypothetical protein